MASLRALALRAGLIVSVLWCASVAHAQGVDIDGGMFPSAGNATSGALNAVAAAGGQTGGLGAVGNPQFNKMGLGLAVDAIYQLTVASATGQGGVKIETDSLTATTGDAENVQLYGNNNRITNPGNFWHLYAQLNVAVGAALGKQSFIQELTMNNSNTITTNIADPFTVNVTQGTINTRYDCGVGPCDHAIDIINNGSTFKTGVLFGSGALDASVDLNPPALSMPSGANGYSIDWFSAAGAKSWQIYSTATTGTNKIILGSTLASISSVVAVPSGSAAGNAIQNAGNAGSGLYFPNVNKVALAAGGNEGLEVNSNGQTQFMQGVNIGGFVSNFAGNANINGTASAGGIYQGSGSVTDLVLANKNGTVALSIATGTTVITLPTVTTGTPAASLCIDASNNIIKKTTTGACV